MKKMILVTVLIAIVSTVSFGKKVVAKGQTFSALGKTRIVRLIKSAMPTHPWK
jgi:hypothetical protein